MLLGSILAVGDVLGEGKVGHLVGNDLGERLAGGRRVESAPVVLLGTLVHPALDGVAGVELEQAEHGYHAHIPTMVPES